MRGLAISIRGSAFRRRTVIAVVVLLALAGPVPLPAAEGENAQRQRLCGDEPCDGVAYDREVQTRPSEDRGTWLFETEEGELVVPATFRSWGVWRAFSSFAAVGADMAGSCYVATDVSLADAAALVRGIDGQRAARSAFGHGVRGNLGRLAASNQELAAGEAGGWSHEWEVAVSEGELALCWVLDAYVEVVPQWDGVSDEELLGLLAPDLDQTVEGTAATQDFDDPRTLAREIRRSLQADNFLRRVFHLATERYTSTTVDQ